MRIRPILFAAAAIACLSSTGGAQRLTLDTLPAVAIDSATADARLSNASSIDRPSDAVRRATAAATVPMAAERANLGAPKAMMAVGAAAIVVGAVIGNDVGTVIMVGGAVVGLYGLWKYLQ